MKVDNVTDDSVSLAWESPETDGGCAITKYIVEQREYPDGKPTLAKSTPATTHQAVIEHLKPTTDYAFLVFAENEIGKCEFPAELTGPIQTGRATCKLYYTAWGMFFYQKHFSGLHTAVTLLCHSFIMLQ